MNTQRSKAVKSDAIRPVVEEWLGTLDLEGVDLVRAVSPSPWRRRLTTTLPPTPWPA